VGSLPSPRASYGGAPKCLIVYDKFHVIQHANQAVDEVRRAEFFRKGEKLRQIVKGKRWLLLTGESGWQTAADAQ
jgi:transposase